MAPPTAFHHPGNRHSLHQPKNALPLVPSTRRSCGPTSSRRKESAILALYDHTTSNALMKRALALGVAALVGVVITPLHLACPQSVAADTSTFTIDTRQASSENEEGEDYFQTVPQGLSSAEDGPRGPKLSSLLEGPKGGEVQRCARKCVPTCIRGGQGAPGLGPMSVRKEIVVFKEGYRTRQYCLSECIQVCSLSYNPPKNETNATSTPP